MESYRMSSSDVISRDLNGNYFYTCRNDYTGSQQTFEIIFNEEGKTKVATGSNNHMVFNKKTIDVNFEVKKIFKWK